MTDSDLRVANTRLQSGGEVNPYTARHMGLFVVGRLASQHGLVVRLRSTIAGEPSSGTTAGVYVPRELLGGADAPHQFGEPGYASPADAHAGIATALALDEDHGDSWADYDGLSDVRDAPPDVPVGLLPQRDPGASGISDIPASLGPPAAARQDQFDDGWPGDDWPEDSMPAQTPAPPERPANTAGFFAARQQVTAAEAQPLTHHDPPTRPQPRIPPEPQPLQPEPSSTAGSDDAIYQRMLSEWLVDPTELANSADLNWESVWDSGWSAAEAADETPVRKHTEEGLPVREPGARLIPGAAESAGREGGHHRNGGAHRSSDGDDEVASAAEFGSAEPDASIAGAAQPQRDPDAVRASISSHFGGVHAGRSQARETRDNARDKRNRYPMTYPPRSTQRDSLDWLVSKFAREVSGVNPRRSGVRRRTADGVQ